MLPIPTYVINLVRRNDRKNNVLKQFNQRPEFELSIIKAIEDKNGALGLWKTIKNVIKYNTEKEFVLICEDDHEFTNSYTKELLFNSIAKAKLYKADILLGGISWFGTAVQIDNDLFWLSKFTGLQFAIIFQQFFDKILELELLEIEAADLKVSELSDRKLVVFPFVSIQKEFGYSDATIKNNVAGRVDKLFQLSQQKLEELQSISKFYNIHFHNEGKTNF